MANETLGNKLLALKERSGLSLSNIAKSGGYRNASSIQRYFDAEFDAEFLPRKLANRLKEALVGFGSPAIADGDIEELTEYGFEFKRNAPPAVMLLPQRRLTLTIDCNPTYSSGEFVDEAELFVIANDPIVAFEKSEKLSARAIHAIYVSTTSLSPRYRPGDVAFYEHERPASIGSDVLVYLSPKDEGPPSAFLAVLAGQGRETYELELLEPSRRFTVLRQEIDAICPVLPAHALLPQRNPRENER